MIVTRPSKNNQTQGYHKNHKGYDFSGRGDQNIYACQSGIVVQKVNRYSQSWISSPPLATRDYGNYLKIRHDGDNSSLYAHLARDTSVPHGKKVAEGEVIAKVGNTGNSTAKHLHFEFRKNNINQKVEFREAIMPNDSLLEELRQKLTWYEQEYPKEQKRVEDCRNDRRALETEAERLRTELKNTIDDFTIRVKSAESREAEKDKAHKDFLATLAEPLGPEVRQNELEIIAAVKRLVEVENLLEGERQDHEQTIEELKESNNTIAQLKDQVKYWQEQARKAKGLGDANTADAIYIIIKEIKRILRKK